MARSPEHEFVTESFILIAEELSRSELYGYTEADRGGFDFACVLERDRSRPLVGQTLTHHAEGIEKDLNWLLFGEDVEIPVYLYAHSTRNESRVQEVLHRASTRLPERARLVRLFRYPTDFDADKEQDRDLLYQHLHRQIVDDLLLNVLFGRLTATDVHLFLNGLGISGLLLASLECIAVHGFMNMPALARHLNGLINPSTVRPRVFHLNTAGMLYTMPQAQAYAVTQRAKIFLQICSLLARGTVSSELKYILKRLDLDVSTARIGSADSPEFERSSPTHRGMMLMTEIDATRNNFGIEISGGPYVDDPAGRYAAKPGEPPWIGR